jgi:hypothetical protein
MQVVILVLLAVVLAGVGYNAIRLRAIERALIRLRDRPPPEDLLSLFRLIDSKSSFSATDPHGVRVAFLSNVIQHFLRSPPRRVIECSSGASTVLLAAAMARISPDGMIYTIQDQASVAEGVRAQLEAQGLSRYVTFIVVPRLVPEEERALRYRQAWFDLTAAPHMVDAKDADVLVVNRLPDELHSRLPAAETLFPYLSRDAHIFVDATEPSNEDLGSAWRVLYPDIGLRRLPINGGALEIFFLDRKIEEFLAPGFARRD